MTKRRACHPAEMQPVWLATAIFAPGHLVRVLIEVATADPMMDAVFRPAKPAEKALGLVHARTVVGDVLDLSD